MLTPKNILYGAAASMVAIAILFSNLFSKVYLDQAGSVLFFSASWCVHCQRFKSQWQRFQVMAGKDYKTLEVPETAHSPLNDTFGVRAYPTIIVVDVKGKRHDYEGPRTAEGLMAFTGAF